MTFCKCFILLLNRRGDLNDKFYIFLCHTYGTTGSGTQTSNLLFNDFDLMSVKSKLHLYIYNVTVDYLLQVSKCSVKCKTFLGIK